MYLPLVSLLPALYDSTHRTDSTMSFSSGTVHLIPETFDVIQAIANCYLLWTEISGEVGKQVCATWFLGQACYLVSIIFLSRSLKMRNAGTLTIISTPRDMTIIVVNHHYTQFRCPSLAF
jgi:hypothetical protein